MMRNQLLVALALSFMPAQGGTHPLHLEHYDGVMWKDDYTIEIRAPQTIVQVWNRPTSTRFEILDALPADFATRFIPRGPKD